MIDKHWPSFLGLRAALFYTIFICDFHVLNDCNIDSEQHRNVVCDYVSYVNRDNGPRRYL